MDYTFEDSVRAISCLDNLLLWLVAANSENQALHHSFLLAYRTMFSIDDILECLSRLSAAKRIPQKYSKDFIFLWVSHYYAADWKKKLILPDMLAFARTIMNDEDFALLKNICVKDIGKRRKPHVHSIPSSSKSDLGKPPKHLRKSIMARPRSVNIDPSKEWSLISSHTIATQLTVMEQELFSDVQPNEFLKDSWQSGHRDSLAPRLNTLVRRFNDVSFWVATQVVMSPTVKHQTITIRKFIKIAHKLFKFNNYNSLMQILSGLHNVSVSRLKSAWAGLAGNAHDKFKRMNDFMAATQNFQQYREAMNDLMHKKAPALPYLVLYMRDITFIEENADHTSLGNVNFLKILRLGRQLHWFEHFSRSDYKFVMDFNTQKILMDLKYLTDAELYRESLASEPKHEGTLGPAHSPPFLGSPRITVQLSSDAAQEPPKRSRRSSCFGKGPREN